MGDMRCALKAGIVAAVLLAACGDASTTPPTSDRVATPQTPPATSPDEASGTDRAADAAPDVTVTTFQGDRFSLADHRGMPVVINFFDSW
jgi:cytochrome oxidase Cu insertion factor (SCO1/SenC/PrrC family)